MYSQFWLVNIGAAANNPPNNLENHVCIKQPLQSLLKANCDAGQCDFQIDIFKMVYGLLNLRIARL